MSWENKILPRKLYDLVIIDLPGIPEKDLRGAVIHHLQGLYPGEINQDLLDYQYLKNGRQWKVLIFVIHPADMEQVNQLRKEERDILLANLFLFSKEFKEYTHVIYEYDDDTEVLSLDNGTPTQSRFLSKARAMDAERSIPEESNILYLNSWEKTPKLNSGMSLFAPKGSQSKRRKILASFAALLISGFLLFLAVSNIQKENQRLEELKSTYQEMTQTNIQNLMDEESNRELEIEKVYLDSLTLPASYRVLSELALHLSPQGAIVRFNSVGSSFSLIGQEYKPLEFLRRIESAEKFTNLKMLKVLPLDNGKEEFTLTGEVQQ